MRALTLWSLVFCLACPGAATARPPRLVVVVSVDQMRADYLDRLPYEKGLKRLKAEGAVFLDAHHVHIPTETGPGHAVILTGRFPGETGIVGNEWWDRRTRQDVYNVADSVHGLGPENLLSYTLGDVLKARDPLSKVVGVSLKDRAAILMSGKRADAVLWYDKKKAVFVTSSYYGAVPSWLGAFNARLRPLADAASPQADAMVRDMAGEVLKRYALGKDEHTDILAVSLSATDYTGHKWGYEGPEMKAQLLALDGLLAELMVLAERAAGAGGFDLVLTADHGVLPVPEGEAGRAMKARRIGWKEIGTRIERVFQDLAPAPGRNWLVGNHLPNIYIDRALADEKGLDWLPLLRQAASHLKKEPGVEHVYVGGEFDPAGPFADAFRRSYLPGRSGDLLVLPAYGVLFGDYPGGTSHGTPYEYDTRVPVLFWGPDFKAGLHAEKARVADIAPTLAALFGLEIKPSEGSQARLDILTSH
jgi:predicted AlkP superfamily pyrophosphatase or phosphodiesterase